MDETSNVKKTIVTQEGYDKLQAELDDLKFNQRLKNAEDLKEARAQGDLSENAEYDAAKDEQARIQGRIEEIEALLKNIEVVAADESQKGKINVGSTVRILDVELGEEEEWKIVGVTEANSLEGKISNESPVGKALIGKQAGDTITVETLAGEFPYKVLEVKAG